MSKKYYIGIDMGTDSVGWAATDCNYDLLKQHGQELWGSYLFDEGEGAQDRRMHRTARRRTARTRQRLLLLQELFIKAVAEKDPLFFLRINNSSFFIKDKDSRLTTRDTLFADSGFTDKEYYTLYPTVYHLRAALLTSEIKDVRLLYLALHHILKNRGHFLFDTQTFEAGDASVVKQKFYEINAFLQDAEMPVLTLERLDDVMACLKNNRGSKREKQKLLADLLGSAKEKNILAIVKGITGGNVNLKELYNADENYEDIKSFSFEKATFEEKELAAIENAVGSDNTGLVLAMKAIYDWSVLCEIMGNEKFISLAKIKIYDKHKNDLKWLKDYIRQNCPQKYANVFRRQPKTNNYAAYIGMDKQKGIPKCSKEDFYAFLKKTVSISDERVLSEMDKGEFLPKQVSDSNGVIPYQVHLQELKAILINAEKYFSFLNEEQDGLTVSEKIISLMTFRIPYYVGPLHTASKYAWSVRRKGFEKVSITPWNFDKAIDTDASEENFIRRTTNKCTYLEGEDVLPANSLLYSEFTFLNELNNLRINGQKDDKARRLIYDYAKEHKKVTLKNCLSLLIHNGILPAGSTTNVFSGTDGDFKNSLASYYDLRFLNDLRDTHTEMCEEIITWITLLSDKQRLEKRIQKKYGNILSSDQIRRLKGLNYSKWGRLSKTLLDGIVSPVCVDENGEPMTIIRAMRKTGENFMQLMSEKYGFAAAAEAFNAENAPNQSSTLTEIEELRCSQSVKRAIRRTVAIVKEIVKLCKCAPEKLFIETARELADDSRKGKRTISRKQQLAELLKNCKAEEHDWQAEIASIPDSKFNSDKLVLYYRQLGRSIYSGRPISLEQVFDTNICDIDHIYPQSKIKDDSIDNRVLVFKTENAFKGDKYPLSDDVRRRMTPFWTALREQGLISIKKYERLVRHTPLTQDELADFINRQLVFTRQSTKLAARILGKILPNTEIVYTKAGNANIFKEKYNITKVRELNDLHHAKDAYVNIVVGNVYNTKFNHNAAVYFNENGINSYNLNTLYDKDIKGAWKVDELGKILHILSKNTCKIVRMTLDGKGSLFDVNPVPAGKNTDLVPLKANGAIADTSKYGGYNKASTAYFMLIKSTGKKGKTMLSLEAYPLYLDKQTNGSKEAKLAFCTDKLGLKDAEILIDNIKLNTLFRIDGSYAWLRGKTGNQVVWCNANQLFLEDRDVKYLKIISNYMRDRKKYNNPDLKAYEAITAEGNLSLFDTLTEKLDSQTYAGLAVKGQVPFLRQKRDTFSSLSLENQCKVIFEVLHLMQCNSLSADLTLLGGVANAGIILTNKFVQDREVKMIFQSPTGCYRRIIRLKDYL